MDGTSDEKIINMILAGEKELFARLVEKYQRKVYNTTYRMLGNSEDASDLTQEAFIKTFRNLKRFRGKASFSTWLFTITTNLCRDELRKRQRRSASPHFPDGQHFMSEDIENIKDNSKVPEDLYMGRETMASIQRAINKLPADQKEVIVLRDIQGFSYKEISEIIGVPMGTVKSRLSRARKSLQKHLKNIEGRGLK